MKLRDLERRNQERLLAHSNGEEEEVNPSDIQPSDIRGYPEAIALAQKLLRLCRIRVQGLQEDLQFIEDSKMSLIEDEQVMVKEKTTLSPAVYKQKYSSEEKRKRQLRIELYLDEEYRKLKLDHEMWKEKVADWNTFISKLKREYELLQVEFTASGGVHTQGEV